MKKNTLSVIVASKNRHLALCRLLKCLNGQTIDKDLVEVIIVNDGEQNKSHEKAYKTIVNNLIIISDNKNSIAKSRNTGALSANGEYLVFVDDDVLVEQDFLLKHYRLNRHHDDKLIAGEIVQMPNKALKQWETDLKINDNIKEQCFGHFYYKVIYKLLSLNCLEMPQWPCSSGANFSINKKYFIKLNGFDSNFNGWCPDDLDFAFRADKEGIKTLVDRSNTAYHIFHPINLKKRLRHAEEAYSYLRIKHKGTPFIDFIRFIWGKASLEELAVCLQNELPYEEHKKEIISKQTFFTEFEKMKRITNE